VSFWGWALICCSISMSCEGRNAFASNAKALPYNFTGYVFSASDKLVNISLYLSSPRFVPTIVGAHRDEDAPGGIGYILCPSIGLTNISTYLVVCHLHNFFTFFLYNFYWYQSPPDVYYRREAIWLNQKMFCPLR